MSTKLQVHSSFAWMTILVTSNSLPSVSRAQELVAPAPRQGYYASLGLRGVSSRNYDHDLGALAPLSGPGVSLRMGEMLTSRLGLGLELDIGAEQSKRWQQTEGALRIEAQLVLWRSLALRGGVGAGFVYAKDKTKRITELKGTGGAAYNVALAYDFFPFYKSGSGALGLTPVVGVSYVPGNSFHSTLLWAGLEIGRFGGLPKHELELPVEEAFKQGK